MGFNLAFKGLRDWRGNKYHVQ